MFKGIKSLFNDKQKDDIIESLEYKVSSLSSELKNRVANSITMKDDYAVAILQRESEIKSLRNDLEELQSFIDHDKSETERYVEVSIEQGIETGVAKGIKEFKKDLEDKIKKLEDKVTNLTDAKYEVEGKYQGALEVITVLKEQVKAGTTLATTLIDKIPDAKISITSPESISQTVNN